ncbi:glutamic acid-rich protein-like [Vigna umbellata]|uniref:glutamic acid-rich protein-like n=1 Tax=Vigna umbellata TaxID=87088 RepID=UPI001F5ECD86|nr:glutamic acid-rich protein-like [Vigna umbellata]XP_047156667.1 glutamic acid-rich protein-like [Vigna umbellata]
MEEGHCEDEVEGEGQADVQPEVGTKMEEGHYEGEVEAQVGTKLEEGDCEVAKQIEHVEDGEVHDVEEVEVHDVNDFELQDVKEDEIEDDHVGDDEGEDDDEHEEVGDDGEDESVSEHGEDEDVDESVSEESLVDVTIECDISSLKRNVREEQPDSPIGESSRTTDNDSMHDVRGLSNTEWVSDELDSGPDNEDDDDSIRRTLFPTFSMPKSLTDYKWEVGTYFTEKRNLQRPLGLMH